MIMCVEDGAYQACDVSVYKIDEDPATRTSGILPSRPRISGMLLTTPRTLSISTFQLIICELSLHLSGVSSFCLQD